MERIDDERLTVLVDFIQARISDADMPGDGDSHPSAVALRRIVHKQVGAIRYYWAIPMESAAVSELHATASWNLLVDIAQVWDGHPNFPSDVAVETFDLAAEHPLRREIDDLSGSE
jgi:hypothetical protein